MSVCGQDEIELSRDGSHYSLSTGILPSLGAKSNRRLKLKPFIISPYDRRYRFLTFFSVVELVANMSIFLIFLVLFAAIALILTDTYLLLFLCFSRKEPCFCCCCCWLLCYTFFFH